MTASRTTIAIIGSSLCTALWVAACSSASTPHTADGAAGQGAAGQSSAGQDAPLDYEAAFPQDRVATLRLTISQTNWDAMLKDMTDLAGEFGASMNGMLPGAGGGLPGGALPGGGALPAEFATACEGLAETDACSVALGGNEIAGTCTLAGDQLTCTPALAGGGPGMLGAGGAGNPGLPAGGDIFSATPVFVECSVESAGQTWDHVGVRFKGYSSLSSSWSAGSYKLPLRLDFDRFQDQYPETRKQRFFGFEKLSLSNGWSDPSLVHDKLGTDIFRDFGLAVPATAFYRVEIDYGAGPVYFGLYTGIELPSDDSFLDTQFHAHSGNLYKPEGTGATWATFDADTLGKENHKTEADFSDATALFDALHADRTDAEAWRTELEQRLNVESFLRWLALNTVIQDWDSYGNMSHNYYLYADPGDGGRFHWIPWDHSFAFGDEGGFGQALSLDLAKVTDAWPLIRFLMDDAVYRERYRALVAEAAQLYSETYPARFQQAHDLIAPFVVGEDGEIAQHTQLSSPQAFEEAHQALLVHPATRAKAVADFLAQ